MALWRGAELLSDWTRPKSSTTGRGAGVARERHAPSSHSTSWAATAGSTSWARSPGTSTARSSAPRSAATRRSSPRRTKIRTRAPCRWAPSGPAPRPAGHVGELPTAHHVTLAGHEGPVLAARFSRGGSYALTCGKDRTFRLWNPFRGTLIKTYEGHARGSRRRVRRGQLAPRDAAATSRCSSGTCPPGRRSGGSGATSPRSTRRRLRGGGSGGDHRRIRSLRGFFDCRSNSSDPIQSVVEWNDAVTCVGTHGGGCRVTGGGVDGSVKTLDVRAGRIHSDDLGHPVTSLAVSGDGQCLLVGMLDGRMCLLDASDGSVMAEYRGHVSATAKVDARRRSATARRRGSEDGRSSSGSWWTRAWT